MSNNDSNMSPSQDMINIQLSCDTNQATELEA